MTMPALNCVDWLAAILVHRLAANLVVAVVC
jgi:hypothetical protein